MLDITVVAVDVTYTVKRGNLLLGTIKKSVLGDVTFIINQTPTISLTEITEIHTFMVAL